MPAMIQAPHAMTFRYFGRGCEQQSPLQTSDVATSVLTFSVARCLTANTKIMSKMSDFEILNGRHAPITNNSGAQDRAHFVEGTV